MKNFIFLMIGVIVGSLTFWLLNQPDTSNTLESPIFQSLNDSEIYQEFNNSNGTDYRKTGGMIIRDSAFNKLRRGIKLGQRNNQNYGFVVGLDSLKGYISRMDYINDRTQNGEDTIHAVRIYLVTSFKKQQTPPRKWKEHLDIMMVPVLANGKNYHDLKDPGIPLVPEFPGYFNSTLPCPQSCP